MESRGSSKMKSSSSSSRDSRGTHRLQGHSMKGTGSSNMTSTSSRTLAREMQLLLNVR